MDLGAHHSLLKELQFSDIKVCRNFLWMDSLVSSFQLLLEKIVPVIKRISSISAENRLSVLYHLHSLDVSIILVTSYLFPITYSYSGN